MALLTDSLLRDETGTPDVPPEVLDHVDQCAECKDKIMDVVLFLGNPDADAEEKRTGETIPLTIPHKNRSFFRGKVAAIFVAMAVSVGAYYYVSQNPLPKTDHNGNQNLKKKNQTQQVNGKQKKSTNQNQNQKKTIKPVTSNRNSPGVDSRYRVNPNLENMVDSRMRGILPEALTPQNNSVQQGAIRFSWVNAFEKSHTLKILNNRNDVLYAFPVSGDFLEIEAKLMDGLYYWKLENENELLHVGKFFVGKAPRKNSQ